MHEMNRSLVAVVSWHNFKFIWLHRSQVIKPTTNWRKIKLTRTRKVEKQGTQEVATLHNIPINNKGLVKKYGGGGWVGAFGNVAGKKHMTQPLPSAQKWLTHP